MSACMYAIIIASYQSEACIIACHSQYLVYKASCVIVFESNIYFDNVQKNLSMFAFCLLDYIFNE